MKEKNYQAISMKKGPYEHAVDTSTVDHIGQQQDNSQQNNPKEIRTFKRYVLALICLVIIGVVISIAIYGSKQTRQEKNLTVIQSMNEVAKKQIVANAQTGALPISNEQKKKLNQKQKQPEKTVILLNQTKNDSTKTEQIQSKNQPIDPYLEFDKYFASKAKVIKASVALKTQYSPVTWPQFGKLDMVDVTVIFQTSGRTQMLALTLSSFFTFNSYPVKKIVAIHDGQTNPGLDQVISKYPNITWIITNFRTGQLSAIDQVYKYIDTDYYFHSENDWEYLRPGFIEYCIQALNFDEKLNGVHLHHEINYGDKPFIAGPLQVLTEIQARWYSGLSFQPSAHRMKEYKLLDHGYTGATFNVSYAKGVGTCESFISLQYSRMGYHLAVSPLVFVSHTGRNQGSAVKFGITQTATKIPDGWDRVVNDYAFWYTSHNNKQKQRQELNYLDQKHKKLGLPQITRNPPNQTKNDSTKTEQIQSKNQPIDPYLEFDKYFASKAKVIKASVALKTQYSPVTWPEFGKLDMVDVTVIFQTSGRTEMLALTLSSFFTFNSYPVKKIVAIHDGQTNPGLDQVISKYPNITWIITNFRTGQLSAIDQVYKYIDTDYYFHSENDWEYLRPGFIEYCIQALNFDEKLNGVHLHHEINYGDKPFIAGPLQVLTEIQARWYSGLSFQPSAHRMKEYKLLDHGYTGATFNVSYAKGVGTCESFISLQYSRMGYHLAVSPLVFVSHTGRNQGSAVKFGITQTATKIPDGWDRVVNDYGAWLTNHNNKQKQRQELNYLDQKHKKLGLPQITRNPPNQTKSDPPAPNNP